MGPKCASPASKRDAVTYCDRCQLESTPVISLRSSILLLFSVPVCAFRRRLYLTASSCLLSAVFLLHTTLLLLWRMYRTFNVLITELADLCLRRFFHSTAGRKSFNSPSSDPYVRQAIQRIKTHLLAGRLVLMEIQNSPTLVWPVKWNWVEPNQHTCMEKAHITVKSSEWL